jgi:Lrp/AsnC family transcriptional regulator for asnA, asnC and gidA
MNCWFCLILDEIDWKVIKHLQLDGRISYRDIGKAIGYTGLGAKKRVEKLLDNEVVRISALINANKLNLQLALIMLETESAEAMRKIVTRYKDCPRIIRFFTTMGGYNLIALVMAENPGTLVSESMEQCALRSGPGIRRSEFYPIGTIHHSPYIPLRVDIPNTKTNVTPCGVHCQECPSFGEQRCVGCPSVSQYSGPLK